MISMPKKLVSGRAVPETTRKSPLPKPDFDLDRVRVAEERPASHEVMLRVGRSARVAPAAVVFRGKLQL